MTESFPYPAESTALIGRTVGGKFRIDSLIGSGAMGAVYKAHQIALDKTVAVKVLHRDVAAAHVTMGTRFQREALAASLLNHPNSIQVIDFGQEADGLLYLVMEYAKGRDLLTLEHEERPLSDRRIVALLSQVLSALAAAHDAGIIHRDLKPENILVVDGTDDDGHPTETVKVCDFGIARLASTRGSDPEIPRSRLTVAGALVGTPEYMSPEQARGASLDVRSDLYSVGVVLFQLLTHTLPFEAETALGVAMRHVTDAPTPPSSIRVQVDPHLEAVCLKALAKDPDDRYPSARAMRADLRGLDASLTPDPNGVTIPPSFDMRRSTSPAHRAVTDAIAARSIVPMRPIIKHTIVSGASEAPATVDPTPRPVAPANASKTAVRAALLALALGAASVVGYTLARRPVAESQAPSAAATQVAPTTSGAAGAAIDGPKSAAAATEHRGDEAAGEDGVAPSADATRGATPHRGAALTGGRSAKASRADAPETAHSTAPNAAAASVPTPAAVAPPPAETTPAPAPRPTTPAPEEKPPLDPSSYRASIVSVSVTNGIARSAVSNALSRADFTGCYRRALRALGTPATGRGTVHLSIDETGRVVGATASVGFLPSARACVEAAARSIRVPNVDTGDATADVQIAFAGP